MNLSYDNELNERIYSRNITDKNLQPLYDFRPEQTKQSIFYIEKKK